MSSAERVRPTYRHGNLREALVAEGLALARAGGPEAVVLREVTRRAGVAANAAYRHFADRDELLSAVSLAALQVVASGMDAEIAAALEGGPADPAVRAAAELDAVGRAYVHLALREPGLFRTAFTVHTDLRRSFAADEGRSRPVGPFARLAGALDRCAAAGLIPADRRAGAELVAWSAVHGLAGLLLDGPLRSLPEDRREAVLDAVLAAVRRGL